MAKAMNTKNLQRPEVFHVQNYCHMKFGNVIIYSSIYKMCVWSLSICCLSPFLKKTYLIFRMMPLLVHSQTRFSPATLSYDMYSCALVMHPLTWRFCHICCKDGRGQLYGLLQCGLAYAWMLTAFHICCMKPNTLAHWQF